MTVYLVKRTNEVMLYLPHVSWSSALCRTHTMSNY